MGRWVPRDDVVRYLELYAAHHRLDVRLGTEVRRIDRSADGDSWTLTLADGTTLTAPYAVVATGFNHTPREPDVPGLQGYSGDVVMARAYRNGAGHAGKDVLVVGTGNTGTELAVDLVEHGAARVRLAVRTVPHILRRNTGPYAAQYTGIAVRHLPTALVDRVAPVVERIQTPDLSTQGLPRPQTQVVLLATTLLELSRVGGFLSRFLVAVLAPVGAAFTHLLLSQRRELTADAVAAVVGTRTTLRTRCFASTARRSSWSSTRHRRPNLCTR